MRVSTMIATKNHFLFVVKNTDVNDELYAAEEYPAGNPIGFFADGTAATFEKETPEGPWTKYASEHTAPILHTRSINSLFGAVAATDDVVYISIIPREDATSGEWGRLSNASQEESVIIETAENTFQIGEHCNIELCRDLNTFEMIEPGEILLDDSDITLTFE